MTSEQQHTLQYGTSVFEMSWMRRLSGWRAKTKPHQNIKTLIIRRAETKCLPPRRNMQSAALQYLLERGEIKKNKKTISFLLWREQQSKTSKSRSVCSRGSPPLREKTKLPSSPPSPTFHQLKKERRKAVHRKHSWGAGGVSSCAF